MCDFDSIEPFRLVVLMLKCVGLWHYEENALNRYNRIFCYILHTVFTFIPVLSLYVNMAMAEDRHALSNALYVTLCETALIVKVVNFIWRLKPTVELISDFESNTIGLSGVEGASIMKKSHSNFRRWRNGYIGCIALTLGIAFAASLYDENLPFGFWVPFPYQQSYKFYFVYFYAVCSSIVTASANCAFDLFQAFCLIQFSIYFEVLSCRLRRFGPEQSNPKIYFRQQIEFHANVSRLSSRCEMIISWPLAVQISMSAFVLCFLTYAMQNLSPLSDRVLFLKLLFFAASMALQIYIPCRFSTDVTEKINELSYAIYDSQWMDLPVSAQKQIITYMEYLKKPRVLTAGNFYRVGLGLFLQTINHAYSLYALMVNMDA